MQDEKKKFGIIGGSGFYNLDSFSKKIDVKTPFGKVAVNLYYIEDEEVIFIARHGEKHCVPPHLVNYRANIFALNKLGVSKVISTSAVGSLHQHIEPGHFVLPNQFIDFTKSRPTTFFDGKFSMKIQNGTKIKGIIHRDFTSPFCSILAQELLSIAEQKNEICHKKGVYVCTEGPRFETPAEINAFRIIGGDVVGMTNVPEVVLARELGMCYGTICVVTNFAAGMQEIITISEVFELFKKKTAVLKDIILNSIRKLTHKEFNCSCKLL